MDQFLPFYWLHSVDNASFTIFSAFRSICTTTGVCFDGSLTSFCRYDSDGHLTNATFPTGEVSSFHSDVEKLTRVELDTSNRENVITATNFSATSTIYTLKQGNKSISVISSLISRHYCILNCQPEKKNHIRIGSFVSSLFQHQQLQFCWATS